MDFFAFESAALRLKRALNVQTDKELAQALGMEESAFNKRKRRGSFPEENVRGLLSGRPELGLTVEDLLDSETQDEFVGRMRSIKRFREVIDALPLPELDRMRLGATMNGNPDADGKALLQYLHGMWQRAGGAGPPALKPDEELLVAAYRANKSKASRRLAMNALLGEPTAGGLTQNIDAPVIGGVAGRNIVNHSNKGGTKR